jgi:hypothetical protein
LVILARRAGSPIARSVGNVTNDPDPTMVFMVPAANATASTARIWSTDIATFYMPTALLPKEEIAT